MYSNIDKRCSFMHANTRSLVPNGAFLCGILRFKRQQKDLVAKSLRAALRKVVLKWKSVSVTGVDVPFV